MELHKYAAQMQQEMMREVEKNQPEYLVFVRDAGDWAMKPQSVNLIIPWVQKYIKDHYEVEGISELTRSGKVVYRWGEEARAFHAYTDTCVFICRRKG
jgi:hypothetical protein